VIELFDVQCGFGGVAPGCRGAMGSDELVAELRRAAIVGGLARITPENLDLDFELSNRRLLSACAAHPELLPCPAVVPCLAGDVASESEQVARAVQAGAVAVCLRPVRDSWLLEPWVCGPLLAAAEQRRLPVFCLEGMVPVPELAKLAASHPRLPLILAGVSYRSHRTYAALLSTFPNVYLSTGNNYCVSGGLENLVARVGAERLLFGTGFPAAEAMAAITLLMYAALSDEQKALIGAGNLRRLREETVR